MKLYYLTSPQFGDIHDTLFLPSLRRFGSGAQVVRRVIDVEGSGDYKTVGYHKSILMKWKILLDAVGASYGSIIAYTDVDVIFLKPFVQETIGLMPGLDIAISREWPEGDYVNSGFMALKCTPRLRAWMDVVFETVILRTGLIDRAVNELLPVSGLRYKLLPHTFASTTNRGLNRDAIWFHANETVPTDGVSSIQLKARMLRDAAAFAVGAASVSA